MLMTTSEARRSGPMTGDYSMIDNTDNPTIRSETTMVMR